MSIDYSLLELIENPKRINNIPHYKLFDYILQAKESQDRFESFILSLGQSNYFAAFGFVLMSSDIVPFKKIFEDKFQKPDSNKKPNGGSEISVFQQLLTYFERKYILSPKNLVTFCSHAYESLSYDEYMFITTVFSQKYKDELYSSFKKMYENGKLPFSLAEWFTFSMNNKPYRTNTFTTKCYPVQSSVKYYKIKNILLDTSGNFVEESESVKILSYLKRLSFNTICEVYVQNGRPYMVSFLDKTIFVDVVKEITDEDFINLIYSGNTHFVFSEGYEVISIANTDNKFISQKKVNCKTANLVSIKNLSSNKDYKVLVCTNEKDELFVVYVPQNIKGNKFSNVNTLNVVQYQNNLYLRG